MTQQAVRPGDRWGPGGGLPGGRSGGVHGWGAGRPAAVLAM